MDITYLLVLLFILLWRQRGPEVVPFLCHVCASFQNLSLRTILDLWIVSSLGIINELFLINRGIVSLLRQIDYVLPVGLYYSFNM